MDKRYQCYAILLTNWQVWENIERKRNVRENEHLKRMATLKKCFAYENNKNFEP